MRNTPLPIDTAPRDSTMVRLLVQFEDHATEDTTGPAWTIGANNDDNVGEDERVGWQFAGWCWTHDHFTEGKGTPVGWLPLLDDGPDLALLVTEYVMARTAYEEAVRPRSGFEIERRLAYDHPALKRWQAARKALSDAVQVEPVVAAAEPPAEPQRLTGDDRTLWGVVANAGRLSTRRTQRWVHVMAATSHGSTEATRLCHRFGFDPDEVVGIVAEEDGDDE